MAGKKPHNARSGNSEVGGAVDGERWTVDGGRCGRETLRRKYSVMLSGAKHPSGFCRSYNARMDPSLCSGRQAAAVDGLSDGIRRGQKVGRPYFARWSRATKGTVGRTTPEAARLRTSLLTSAATRHQHKFQKRRDSAIPPYRSAATGGRFSITERGRIAAGLPAEGAACPPKVWRSSAPKPKPRRKRRGYGGTATPRSGTSASPLAHARGHEEGTTSKKDLPCCAERSNHQGTVRPVTRRWFLRCAADEQPRFVILNEVKDPTWCCSPTTRRWILRCAQDDRLS